MRTKLFSNLITVLPTAIAIIILILFSSAGKTKDDKDATATVCCTGYNISVTKLKKFMLDSLHGIQFEGGVYSKSALLDAINATPGDSIYLINGLVDCSLAKGTTLAITSPTANGVSFIGGAGNCRPCPAKACCHTKLCIVRIKRACIVYQSLSEAVAEK